MNSEGLLIWHADHDNNQPDRRETKPFTVFKVAVHEIAKHLQSDLTIRWTDGFGSDVPSSDCPL